MSRNVVLMLTHSADFFTVDRVAAALSQRGARVFRLDTDLFPLNIRLSARLSNQGMQHRLEYGEDFLDAQEVQAVWMRKIWTPQLSKDLAPQFQDACIRESQAALYGFLDSLSYVRWLDPLQQITAAENKLWQLRVATEVGLPIPRTIVTNDPKEARAFFRAVEGKMVAKLLTPFSTSMEGNSLFVYTSVVKEEDLADAETLRYSPMVFQEEIPKYKELRVVFVAGKFFVGALDTTRYAATTMDWRRASAQPDECLWETARLPIEVQERISALMSEFGLLYGAIDLIHTPAGEYVFLEVNPSGEWGMLERDLGYPISEAIADALLA